jgi:hypothetical protein
MTNPNITTLTGLNIVTDFVNPDYGFYLPQLTTAQRNAIPLTTIRNGALVYNITTNTMQAYQNGAWVTIQTF